MIRDIQQYWREIRELEATLEEFLWLMPTHPERTRGNGNAEEFHPVEVSGPNAARMLHQKSHRIATKEEVEAYRAREAGLNRAAKKEQLRRKGRAQIVISSNTKD